MEHQNGTVEEILGRIARRQHGVVARKQLLAAGEARYHAAVLACGDGAVLSGQAAGYLWGLVKGTAPPPEVTAPTNRRVNGVRTRRARRNDTEATTRHGIPITTVPRTLVDLSSLLSSDDLARACHEAGVLHGTTPPHVEEILSKRPNTPGAKQLRRVMRGEVHVTLSRLERRFLKRLDEAGLPRPVTNQPAGGRRVDCRWPAHNLTVELDSYRYHSSRHAWELDRRREREAHARGDQFRRYTRDDVFGDPEQMLVELCALLRVAAT